MKYFIKYSFIVSFLLLVFTTQSQDNNHDWFKYISPKPDAKYIMPEQKISFRLQNQVVPKELLNIKINLMGSVSGIIEGKINLASDYQTVVFNPLKKFALNELIEVHFQFPKALNIPDFSSSFSTSSMPSEQRKVILTELYQEEIEFNTMFSEESSENKNYLKSLNDSLLEGFPEISITHWADPSEGYIFISPLDYINNTYFQIILDNYATPVYYRNVLPFGAMGFKLQPNGYLTSYITSIWKFIVLNTNYEVIDTISAQNGYVADMHELRYYNNMHSFFMCYDPQIVDMSLIVPGGQTDAIVTGLILQELDENKEVVFQWRSWDHFQITDASNWIDLTESTIDYVHGNSIEVVSEDEIMISCRNMNEVTKIDRNTGDIIWRLNGENNMFDFFPSADSFCVQHTIRLMPDSSNISLFDNGGCWVPQYSSAVEFILDEENFTCTMIERLQSDPDIYGAFMGNSQRLLNGNTINGWGKGIPSVTEFDHEGNILLQFSFPLLNYQAFKFNWQHTVFYADVEEIDFGSIYYHDSAYTTLTLTNNYDQDITINRVLNHKDVFSITNDLPILLPQGGSAEVQVKFKPENVEIFDDMLTFCWDINTDTIQQRIAIQVELSGSATGDEGIENMQKLGFKIYPNPFKNEIIIKSEREVIEEIEVLDMAGKMVFRQEKIHSRIINQRLNLPAGVYLLRIKTKDGNNYSTNIARE